MVVRTACCLLPAARCPLLQTPVAGAAMMREKKGKDSPFNLNACLILGRAALLLRDYDAAEALYDHAVEASTKLNSGLKMREAYIGLSGALFGAKKYTAAVDVCEKVI